MSVGAIVLRLMLNFLTTPEVQGSLRQAGRIVLAAGTRAFIQAVRNGNPRVESKRVK